MTTTAAERTDSGSASVSLGSGAALAVVAGGLLALNRFGGLAGSAPRAFMRLVLVVVWGWIALAIAIWFVDALFRRRRPIAARLEAVLAGVGRAHLPLVGLALVLFVAAGALQLRWPGMLAAIGVFAWWFPVGLLAAAPPADRRTVRFAVVTVPYALWLVVVGTHLHDRLGHLV